MTPEFSRPRTEKRRGRPKGSLGPSSLAIRDAITELTELYERMTVRQVFYKLEMAAVVEKTESGYRQVQRQVLAMRRDGTLSWLFITDGTRWQRKPSSFDDVDDYAAAVARSYRRDLWQSQGVRVEVWLEKDALADVIYHVTDEWDVSLMVSRGQSSATFLYAAAQEASEAFERSGAATYIYALYDHDAGGDRSARTIAAQLPEFAPDVPIYFERLAVTSEQIGLWGLPTRPPKSTDPQARVWGDKPAVELDAIDPNRLTGMVRDAILRHVDEDAWAIEKTVEEEERQGLLALLERGEGR